MRNQGNGVITLTWTGTVVSAFLVWSVMPPGSGLNMGTLNGVPLTGSSVGSDFGPCWSPPTINTYIATVPTSAVINGPNTLTGFASGITSGANPWGSPTTAPLLEGASLIVTYAPIVPTPTREVVIYTGALTAFGGSLSSTFPHPSATTSSAKTTYIVSDGQLPGNHAFWNSALIDSNAFPGSDPKLTPTPWTFGHLYDTKTYSVPVVSGSTSETATIDGSGSDCITWDAQVLRTDLSVIPVIRPTSTVVVCNPGTVPVNDPTTCTATVTDTGAGPPTAPTGPVSFTSTGSGMFSSPSCMLMPISSSSSSCSVGYTPNPGSEGTHTITATYAGNPTHSGSAGTFQLMVTKRTTTTSVGCMPGTVLVNVPTTCTATVTDTSPGTPITPTGPVTWTSSSPGSFTPANSCMLSPVGVGVATCSVMYTPAPGSEGTTTITATYGGDTDHLGSQGTTTITVTKRPTSTSINCNPGSVPVNAPTTCTATVTDTGPGMPIPPIGSVGFTSSVSGSFSSPSCMLMPMSTSSSSCSVTYTPNPGSEGTHTITGTYGGDPDHSGSVGSFGLTVTKRSTSTSVSCSPNFVQPGQSTTCQASVTDTSPGTSITPTGTVTWTSSGTGSFSPSSSCTLSGSGPTATCTITYTPTSTGTQVITATYQGDTDHFGSSGSTQLAVGVPPKSAVTDSSLCYFDQDPTIFGQQFTLIYIEDSHNPGTFELVSSNPGQFYYNVFYNGPPESPVTLQIRIPYPFITQGAVPIQEFGQVGFTSQGCFVPSDQLSGFTATPSTISLSSYTPQAMGSFTTITVSGTVPSTGLVYVTIHLSYGFKGVTGYTDVSNNAVNTDTSKNVPQLQSYTFSFNTVVGAPQGDSQTIQSENVFKGCAKGFCGMVMDSQGTPVSGAPVQVYSSTGQLLGTFQTDQYGFYSIPYTLLGTNLATFTIAVPTYNLQRTVTLAIDTFTVTNFTTP